MNFTRFSYLFYKEVRRFLRVLGQTVVTPLINATLYLLIFGVSLGSRLEVSEDLPYLIFLVPGLMMMGVINNSFQNASSSLVICKFHGELEDLKVVPLNPHQIVWGFCLGGLCRGLMVGCLIYGVGLAFTYVNEGIWLPMHNPWMLLFFLTLGGISFAQLGVWIGFIATTFDQIGAFTSFILLPLIYLGGVFFSLEHLHIFWKLIAMGNPLLYYINGVRGAMIGTADVTMLSCVMVSMTTLAVTSSLAYWSVLRGSYHRF